MFKRWISFEKEERALVRKESVKSKWPKGRPRRRMPVVISGEVFP